MSEEITQSQSTQPSLGQTEITFASLNLAEPLQRALNDKNYVHPSPIQAQAIPHLLQGRDLIGLAQTGTGKTAAFALPILQHLETNPRRPESRHCRVLILTPTRELASQIGESFRAYGRHLRLTHTVIFGGVGQTPQVRALHRGVDVVIATPGRLLDLQSQGHVKLGAVEIFVLDEADRMLDMGFINDVKKLMAQLPAKRQSLLFSATMPPAIQQLANSLVSNPVRVEVTPVASTVDRIDQHLCHVDRSEKPKLLLHVLEKHSQGLVLVFVRMKHGANRLVEHLEQNGVRADAIHGNKSQAARQRALENFRTGKIRVLVATDIAARGIDVKGVALVVNFDLPEEPESYVHRIGRTARAGAEGIAIAFCDRQERGLLRDIERTIRKTVPVNRDHPFAKAEQSTPLPADPRGGANRGGNRQGGNGQSRGYGSRGPGGQGQGGFRSQDARGPRPAREGAPQGQGRSQGGHAPRPAQGGGAAPKRNFFGFGARRPSGSPTLRG